MASGKKQVMNRHLEAAVKSFRSAWNDDSILGDARGFVYSVAVPYVMHPAVALMVLYNLGFLAANGIKASVRSAGAKVTSFGSFFYHGKKTGKSNYTRQGRERERESERVRE